MSKCAELSAVFPVVVFAGSFFVARERLKGSEQCPATPILQSCVSITTPITSRKAEAEFNLSALRWSICFQSITDQLPTGWRAVIQG